MRFLRPKNSKQQPFLTLNGVRIPISAEGTSSSSIEEIGTRQRGVGGSYFVDRCKSKSQYSFDVCLMSQKDACALEGMIQGEGESYLYKEDLYSCKGDTHVFAGVGGGGYITNEFGTPFQEPVAPINPTDAIGEPLCGAFYKQAYPNCSEVALTDSDAANWVTPSFSGLTTVSDYTEDLVTPYPSSDGSSSSVLVEMEGLAFEPISTSSAIAVRQILTGASFTPGECYTISFYVRALNPAFNGKCVNAYIANGAAFTLTPGVVGMTSANNTLMQKINVYSNQWTRYEFTWVQSSLALAQDVWIVLHSEAISQPGVGSLDAVPPAGDVNFLVDGIQYEKGVCAARPFVEDEFETIEHTYDLKALKCNSGGITVSFRMKKTIIAEFLSEVSFLGHQFFENPGNGLLFRFPGWAQEVQTDILINDTDWHLFTFVLDGDCNCDDGMISTFYFDGAQMGSFNIAQQTAPCFDDLDDIFFFQQSEVLSDLQFLPYAATPQMVEGWQTGNGYSGCAPRLRAEGLFDKRCAVEVVGQVTDKEFVSVNLDGCWVSNAVRMSITLTEV